MRGVVNLQIPSVMLTVLGVVIGFVISYRAMSGYERYWLGRSCWSDVIRNSRTLSRFIWFHVPPRLTPKTQQEIETGQLNRTADELNKVMAEKLVALDLVEGFAVALKHHIRGELGIYYEDLYPCVRPMHDHDHNLSSSENTQAILASSLPPPRRAQQITKETDFPTTPPLDTGLVSAHINGRNDSAVGDTYGTFVPNGLSAASTSTHSLIHNLLHKGSHSSVVSTASTRSQHQPLLPSSQPPPEGNVMDQVSEDMIPFAGMISSLMRQFRPSVPQVPPPSSVDDTEQSRRNFSESRRKWQGPVYSSNLYIKHKVVRGGESLPLEILRCISEWCSTLEDRGTVPGSSLGPMIGTVAAFEDSLTTLERILTTPLPFVYSVHIRCTVWVYLFFLPFQLVSQFGYYAIPGVAIAAFIYLGFIAAGEEIEQPFGYDDNDLDLDLFCRDIIRADITQLKTSPCLNAYFDPKYKCAEAAPRPSFAISELSHLPSNYYEAGVPP
ncbi:hypothetical protein HYPSUDRAFT_155545 [Hypholoma sublateritium FD-334 SS-4]|uniref:Uncharacterized protein n=1 Tax=Hypholoma sublateritium (strain FD-334 SS-4) TaxID=945553 RepID=A0A0D2LKR8_HYPSF|nr:hypothetical protein HYPSUDRAFT_155545 [Hypholoma sublateritium FD-334 SS-4]